MLFADREHSEARPPGPHTRGSASPARWPAAPASLPLLLRGAQVALAGSSLRALCACVLPVRSPCTPIHLPTRTTGGHDGPKSPVTLRVHAPRFRLRRRPCSHLRRTPCDQDDQPADKAGASHAGAHDGRCALPFRAACISSRAPSIPGCVPSVRASRVMSQTKYLTFCKPDTLPEICAAHKPDLRCKTVTRASIQALSMPLALRA